MDGIDRLWAGWRSEYVSAVVTKGDVETDHECVFCALVASELPASETTVIWRGDLAFAVLNAYPYGTGHTLVMPLRHVGELQELTEEESTALWHATRNAVTAVRAAYECDGVNVGMNLGAAAGAGIPGHLHMHVLPRWSGDTNFMSSVANARVLPESLHTTWEKMVAAWPVEA